MLFKNTASQKIRVFAFDSTTGLPKTGDAANVTASLSKDFAAFTDLTDTSATEEDSTKAKGYYLFDVSQSETNADDIAIAGRSSTSNIVVVGAPARVATRPPNAGALSIDSSGRVDVIKINGTSQTARDLGTSVLIAVGTGTGQINLSSGKVPATLAATDVTGNVAADLQTIKTQAVTAAAGVTFPTSVASPTNITAGTITTVITLTNLPAVPTDWLTAAGVKTDAVTKIQAGLATPTNITAGTLTTVTTATNLTNAPGAGDFTAAMKVSLNAATPASVTGDVAGKVLGGGAGTITGLGVNANTTQFLGHAVVVDSNNYPGVNIVDVAGATATGSGGVVNANMTQVAGQTVTCSAAVTVLASVGTAATSAAQTGDNFARLGAPAGVSLSADVAAVNAKTTNLPAAPASTTNITAGTLTTVTTVTNLTNLPSVPTDWLTAAGVKTDAVTKIQAGLALATTALSTAVWTATRAGYLENLSAGAVALASQIPANFTTATFASAGVFSTGALANAPTGGSAPSAGTVAAAVWDLTTSGHTTSGTFGSAMNAAGSAGDPWATDLPGSYGAGTAGYAVGHNLDATVASRMATFIYTAPDNSDIIAIKAKTDNLPASPASTTNITAGTITTVTNLTNLPAITTDWITAAGVSAAAVTKVQTGLYAGADTTGTTSLLALAGGVNGFVAIKGDTAAVKAKTDNLPSDPADASDVAGAFSTVNTTLGTIAGYIDTEVAAIKAKTDNLPSSPAAVGSAMTVSGTVNATLVSTGLDAIAIPTLTGPATTFPGMMVQLWRRFFKKAARTSTTLTTYANDGTTAVTTQTVSDDGSGAESQSAAT